MSSCVLIRSTFRLHDSPVLKQALNDTSLNCIIVPIESNRVCHPSLMLPTFAKREDGHEYIKDPHFVTCKTPHLWGYHQYVFMLHVIRSYIRDLNVYLENIGRKSVRIEVWKATASQMVKTIASDYSTCYLDRVDDPAWQMFDSSLRKAFSKNSKTLTFITTQTILDWAEDPECKEFLQEWRTRWHIPKSNAKFKAFVIKTLARRENTSRSLRHTCSFNNVDNRSLKRSRSQPVKGSKTKGGRAKKTLRRTKSFTNYTSSPNPKHKSAMHLNVDNEYTRWKLAFDKHNVQAYDLAEGSLEQFAIHHLETTVKTMELTSWNKPSTNVSLGIRDHAPDPIKDTSKLSPYFALGVLSPRLAFSKWWGPNPKSRSENGKEPSSAVGQLLWRETFHAASHLPNWWVRRQPTLTKDQRFWRHELEENKPYGGWKIWKGTDKNPLYQQWLTATTGMFDLDESLMLLVKQGWIHHLRRHMIADYLTRGKAQADWMIGESWFRQTLIDHDACINRGNWLWLSASDFSVHQRFRHYKYTDYVERHSYGSRAEPLSCCASTSNTNGAKTKGGNRVGSGVKAHKKTKKQQKTDTHITQPIDKKSFGRYLSGGFPDPRKTYVGHYKNPPKPIPVPAVIHSIKGPSPVRSKNGLLHFKDHSEFAPECSPAQILNHGAFGGTYFRDIWSSVLHKSLKGSDAVKDLPPKWFSKLDMDNEVYSKVYNKNVNYFKVVCGGSLDMWETSGWINPIDPYGWFQWYCRFYNGRRTSDDDRQIKRWQGVTKQTGRFVSRIRKKCKQEHKSLNESTVLPGVRQSLLHWGLLTIHN